MYHRDMLGGDLSRDRNPHRWPSRIVLAGVVLATLAAATAIVLLQPAPPAPQTLIPGRLRATVDNGVAGCVDARTDRHRRARSGASCQRAPRHDAAAAHHPAPISVSPESRAPFLTRLRPGRTNRAVGYSADFFS